MGLLIADCQLPIANWRWAKHQSEIGNRQLTIGNQERT
jgi:hypothetical protein